MVRAIVLAAALALAACQTSTSGGSFCDVADPIRLTDEAIAAMSDGEVDAAVAHNEKGEALCGWKPRG